MGSSPIHRLGLVKTSLLDYPGLVASLIFLRGCNLRCPWCHNPPLVIGPTPADFVDRAALFDHLRRRKKVIQGVVVTGGEPLMHAGLPEFLADIKALGYKIKLDTNGTYPERLAALPDGLVDFVAMDLKMAPAHYGLLGPVHNAVNDKVIEAAQLIRRRWPEHEFRTTWVPGFTVAEDLAAWADLLPGETVSVTGFRPGTTLDPAFGGRAPTPGELAALAEEVGKTGLQIRLR